MPRPLRSTVVCTYSIQSPMDSESARRRKKQKIRDEIRPQPKMTTVKRPTRPFPLRTFFFVFFILTIPSLLLIAFLTLRTSSETTADIHTTTSTSSSLPEKEASVTMGFTKTILQAGNGLKPKKGQSVTVHCTGFGKNRDFAQKFWSTKDPGQEPFTFAVGRGQGM
jgi:hypothetical protein